MFYVFCSYNYTKYEVAKKKNAKNKLSLPKIWDYFQMDISTFKIFTAKYYNKYEFGSKYV